MTVLKHFINSLLIRITKKNISYHKRIFKNKIKRIIKQKVDNKFLFILSPPYCGSTLLHQIISTSPNVSIYSKYGTREGQQLPIVKDIMVRETRWEIDVTYDWLAVKKEWMKYWDVTLPVLLEKSPPSIIRAKSLESFFSPSYFIILYRNPYAHCIV